MDWFVWCVYTPYVVVYREQSGECYVDHVSKITNSAIVIEFGLVKNASNTRKQNHHQCPRCVRINCVLELSRLIRVSSVYSVDRGNTGESLFCSVLVSVLDSLRGEGEKKAEERNQVERQWMVSSVLMRLSVLMMLMRLQQNIELIISPTSSFPY